MKKFRYVEPKMTKKDEERGKILMEYLCGFCGYKFKQKIMEVKNTGSKHSHWSSQVRCPFCFNFVRTFEEGKEVKK